MSIRLLDTKSSKAGNGSKTGKSVKAGKGSKTGKSFKAGKGSKIGKSVKAGKGSPKTDTSVKAGKGSKAGEVGEENYGSSSTTADKGNATATGDEGIGGGDAPTYPPSLSRSPITSPTMMGTAGTSNFALVANRVPNGDDDGGNYGAAIGGALIGIGTIGMIVVVAALLFARRKRRHNKDEDDGYDGDNEIGVWLL